MKKLKDFFIKNKQILTFIAVGICCLTAVYFLFDNTQKTATPVSGSTVSQTVSSEVSSTVNTESKAKDTTAENTSAVVSKAETESAKATASEKSVASKQKGSDISSVKTKSDKKKNDTKATSSAVTSKRATTPKTYKCELSISCKTILDNFDKCRENKKKYVPDDGWILRPVTVTFSDGESVFDVLKRVCKSKKIHMEFSWTPAYNSAYIEGIHNLYEFDVGQLSSWMYKVNGWFPNYGCSSYKLKNGDKIEFLYTCNLGDDVGGGYSVGS